MAPVTRLRAKLQLEEKVGLIPIIKDLGPISSKSISTKSQSSSKEIKPKPKVDSTSNTGTAANANKSTKTTNSKKVKELAQEILIPESDPKPAKSSSKIFPIPVNAKSSKELKPKAKVESNKNAPSKSAASTTKIATKTASNKAELQQANAAPEPGPATSSNPKKKSAKDKETDAKPKPKVTSTSSTSIPKPTAKKPTTTTNNRKELKQEEVVVPLPLPALAKSIPIKKSAKVKEIPTKLPSNVPLKSSAKQPTKTTNNANNKKELMLKKTKQNPSIYDSPINSIAKLFMLPHMINLLGNCASQLWPDSLQNLSQISSSFYKTLSPISMKFTLCILENYTDIALARLNKDNWKQIRIYPHLQMPMFHLHELIWEFKWSKNTSLLNNSISNRIEQFFPQISIIKLGKFTTLQNFEKRDDEIAKFFKQFPNLKELHLTHGNKETYIPERESVPNPPFKELEFLLQLTQSDHLQSKPKIVLKVYTHHHEILAQFGSITNTNLNIVLKLGKLKNIIDQTLYLENFELDLRTIIGKNNVKLSCEFEEIVSMSQLKWSIIPGFLDQLKNIKLNISQEVESAVYSGKHLFQIQEGMKQLSSRLTKLIWIQGQTTAIENELGAMEPSQFKELLSNAVNLEELTIHGDQRQCIFQGEINSKEQLKKYFGNLPFLRILHFKKSQSNNNPSNNRGSINSNPENLHVFEEGNELETYLKELLPSQAKITYS